MGIYKRKQESKKTRKHAFDQESDQEKTKNDNGKKKKKRKHNLDQEKKKKLFLDCFLGRERVFFRFFLIEIDFLVFLLSCFLL